MASAKLDKPCAERRPVRQSPLLLRGGGGGWGEARLEKADMKWPNRFPMPLRLAALVLLIAGGALIGRIAAAAMDASREPLVTTGDLVHMITAWAILVVLYYAASFILHRMMRGIDE